MSGVFGKCLYADMPVPIQVREGGAVHWLFPDGYEFLYDAGVLHVWNGLVFMPLCECHSWQYAVQVSRGFRAGRTVPRLWKEPAGN